MKITVVEVNNIAEFPPVINLVRILLDLGCKVNLISNGISALPEETKANKNLKAIDIEKSVKPGTNAISKVVHRVKRANYVKKAVDHYMKDSDILWTTSANSVRDLGEDVLKYKNVLQLMELCQYGYIYKGLKFPLGDIAKKSWKVVVPEENRAFIEQVWWDLPKLPTVLPNKPYSLEYGNLSEDTEEALRKIKNEKRKIILYLGAIWPDRDLVPFAKAVGKLGSDYVFYIIGKPFGESPENQLKVLQEQYSAVHLGAFNPPQHLAFVKYAHIGLTPYKPAKSGDTSELNALYCAPNKIYEYAGYGVPMVGTKVPGLLYPFEKYHMGVCCDDLTEEKIADAVKTIENDYQEYQKGCYRFYKNIDNEKIVKGILEID